MWKKIVSAITTIALLVTSLPWDTTSRSAAVSGYETIYTSLGAPIINASDMPFWFPFYKNSEFDFFSVFKRHGNKGTGVTWWAEDDGPDFDGITIVNGRFKGQIHINQIPELKLLAESGQGKVMVRYDKLDSTRSDPAAIQLNIGGSRVWESFCKTSDTDFENRSSDWHSFGPNDVVEVETWTPGADTKVIGIHLYFADITAPVYYGNSFTHDGTVRYNSTVGKDELFLRGGQSANVRLNFSEKVYPGNALSVSESTGGKFNFLQTELFSNPGGDGFDPAIYKLKSTDPVYSEFSASELRRNNHSQSAFNLSYQAKNFDSTNNAPLDPSKLTVDLLGKMNGADFTDAAGNPVQYIGSIGTVPFANNNMPNGSFRTIIDARVPEYSKVKNGVQPDILTGVVVNKGDKIRFIVNVNEMVTSGYSVSGLQIKFNNGMTANYVSGDNTDTWIFETEIPSGTEVDTAQLEAVALQHVNKPSDGAVLKDYAGNLLVDSIKSIQWANLSVDNGKPNFKYTFTGGEPTGAKYRKSGNIAVSAVDPDLNGSPSKGIFGPNGSGDGMFYYLWTKSETDPFAAKAVDNFAAIKRFSMTMKQASEELYPGELETVILSVANNHETIEMPEEAKTEPGNSTTWYLHTYTADKTWDSARQLMQYEKGKGQVELFKQNNPNATVFDIEKYFRDSVLPTLGQYDEVAQWPISDYKKDDSNWTHQVAALRLDNMNPEAYIGNITDDNSDEVEATIQASDATSQVEELYYQLVYEGEEAAENAWVALEGSGKQLSVKISAKNNPMVKKSGNYFIHAKAVDQAGNWITAEPVKVRILKITTSYSLDNKKFVRNDGNDFRIEGLPIAEVSYAYSPSSDQPTAWTKIESALEKTEEIPTAGLYKLAKDYSKNGTWFVHFKVKQGDRERYYYYYKEYKMDHLPPVATFSSQGFLYPLPEQETDVTVADTLVDAAGVLDANISYQWVKKIEGQVEKAPDENDLGWKTITGNRKLKLNVDSKTKDGDYKLYVLAKDSLTNSKIYAIDSHFAVYYQSKEKPVGTAKLIKVVDDPEQGNLAIIQVEVDVPNKHGYTYSVSANNGENWTKWRPYTNYVSAAVDSDKPEEILKTLRVKFKGLYGNVSDSYTPVKALVDDQAYALASLETIDPVLGGVKAADGGANKGLEILFAQTEGKTVTATPRNIETPEVIEPGKAFRVYQNGNYNFDVVDANQVKNQISIVVSNFDSEAPVASLRYNVTKPTNSNVLVTLVTSEPVRILNPDQDSKAKLFTENGQFTFEFEDAVGLKGSATATVANIDKEAPEVSLIYRYNHPDTRALILKDGKQVVVDVAGEGFDENGLRVLYEKPNDQNVILTNRMTVEVVNKDKPEEVKAFKVIRNTLGNTDTNLDVRKNGTVTFVVADDAGNVTTISSKEMTTILSADPEIKAVNMTYVDDKGQAIDPSKVVNIQGQDYVKGKIQVTLEADVDPHTGSSLMVGNTPLQDFKRLYSKNGKVSLGISDVLGNTSYVNLDIKGIDGIAPKLELKRAYASIVKNAKNFNFAKDLGGYTVTDNLSDEKDIQVTLKELIFTGTEFETQDFDISKPGKHVVLYLAQDQVGNVSITDQTVYVLENGGMKLYADGMLLTEKADQTAIMKSSKVVLDIQDFDLMGLKNNSQTGKNELASYTLAYYPGLYREGQMKYIGQKLTLKDLLEKQFEVTFPKAGWYTIVLQNQERETLFVTILISKK